jgi:hypothetical protein
MPKRGLETVVRQLVGEAHAIELLLSETQPSPEHMAWYWDVTARLINLVADIEAFASEHPLADATDSQYLALRRALAAIESEVLLLGQD